MQILIPSSTPLQVSWCMMSGGSTSPGFLWVFGTRQRTKWGSQLCRVACASVLSYGTFQCKVGRGMGMGLPSARPGRRGRQRRRSCRHPSSSSYLPPWARWLAGKEKLESIEGEVDESPVRDDRARGGQEACRCSSEPPHCRQSQQNSSWIW